MALSSSLQLHPINYIYTLWNNRGQIGGSLMSRSSAGTSNSIDSFSPTIKSLFGVPISYRYYLDRLRILVGELQNPWTFLSITGFAVSLYIIYPSLRFKGRRNDMHFTKRPDKYTTGFINPSIDCFANSNLQALSSLPTLNVYLNVIETIFQNLRHLVLSENLSPLTANEGGVSLPDIKLHEALMTILGKLQSTIFFPRAISVWDFLHVLENIHDAHISRNQHDAHELLQLILETLMKEYTSLKTVYKSDPVFSAELKKDGIGCFPEFPFSSEVASNFRCMRCGKLSSITYNPMMISSIGLPEESSVTLSTLLKRNESEIIEDYSCMVCKVRYIFATKADLIENPKKLELVDKLQNLYDRGKILINSDLDQQLESFIDNYPGIHTSGLKSVVHREVSIVKPPQILILHLSRSIYEATHAWRNSCQVQFDTSLLLNVDQRKAAKYYNKTQLKSNPDNEYISTKRYSFTLRSVIRHIGSHSSGHYECYKRKPKYYKQLSTGKYYTREPNIIGFTNDTDITDNAGTNIPLNSNHQGNNADINGELSGDILNGVPNVQSTSNVLKKVWNERDKVLKSCLKKPFWKISDDVIKEVHESKVLSDGEGVYMLFYDRSDCLNEELL